MNCPKCGKEMIKTDRKGRYASGRVFVVWECPELSPHYMSYEYEEPETLGINITEEVKTDDKMS